MPTPNQAPKTHCERCACDLPLEASGALICSFHCTFCADCNATQLHDICPNCMGELLPRPRRRALNTQPSQTALASSEQASHAITGADLKVRIIGLDEVESVVDLFDQYRQFYDQPTDHALARRFLAARQREGNSVLMLATADGKSLGFAQLYPMFSSVSARPAMVLNDLYVAGGFRGRGVATSLLRAATNYGAARGLAWLTLATSIDNHVAQRLYRKLGWRQDDQFLHFEFALPSTSEPAT